MRKLIPCIFIAIAALGLVFAACDNDTTDEDFIRYAPLVVTGKDNQSKDVELTFSTAREAAEEGQILSKLQSGDSYVIKLDGKTLSEGTLIVSDNGNISFVPKSGTRFQGSYLNGVLKFSGGPVSGFVQTGTQPPSSDASDEGGNNGSSTPVTKTYTVTFDKNGGDTEADPKTKTVTSPPASTVETLPKAPTREGYTFTNWNDGNGSDFNANTPVTANITVYAQWTQNAPDSYAVEFIVDGGTFRTLADVPSGTKITAPDPEPTKDGHTFDNWYKEDTLTNLWNFTSDTVTKDITLYAKWNTNQYTVTFMNDDEVFKTVGVNYGNIMEEPIPAPVKEHYGLDSWNKEDATPWNFDTDIVTGDTILYAKWTADPGLYREIAEGEWSLVDGFASISGANIAAAVAHVNENSGVYRMLVGEDIATVPLPPILSAHKLTVEGSGDATITLTANGNLFTVNTGAELTLGSGITLQGHSGNNASLVRVNGTFTMESGTISGNEATQGGGVYVAGGAFTMKGDAAIEGNEATQGGGVFVNSGTFTMEGGTISGNTTNNGPGGGVFVANAGTFIMGGGTISGNTANNGRGGGVFVGSAGTFTKTGPAVIAGNNPGGYANNTAVIGNGVFVDPAKYRNADAGSGVNLDSRHNDDGNWNQ